jgi:hypothetical protein
MILSRRESCGTKRIHIGLTGNISNLKGTRSHHNTNLLSKSREISEGMKDSLED